MNYENALKKNELIKSFTAKLLEYTIEGGMIKLFLDNGLEIYLLKSEDFIKNELLNNCLRFDYDCSIPKTILTTNSKEELESKTSELEIKGLAYKINTTIENKYHGIRQQIMAESLHDGPKIKPSGTITTYQLKVFVEEDLKNIFFPNPLQIWKNNELIYDCNKPE